MKNNPRLSYSLFIISYSLFALSSCSVNKQISQNANKILLQDTAIRQGHIGISIYEPTSGKYWYEHNAEKYFIPASNTKLFTLYAGMKYLGDSLVGLEYVETADTIYLKGAGDPTLFHPDFIRQPVFSFLKKTNKKVAIRVNTRDNFEELGKGWAWDDYESSYMAERSAMPIYGNVATFQVSAGKLQSKPSLFAEELYMVLPPDGNFEMHRNQFSNQFYLRKSYSPFTTQAIPFKTDKSSIAMEILYDSLGLTPARLQLTPTVKGQAKKIFSQPKDSLFKMMMHRSDNFFAEQTLLMASNEYLGYMSDDDIIDTILKTHLKDVPQMPKWVDGSGLSRYNLFTPQSFVWLLHQMKNDFGWERMQNI
ncbi:MAG: D-alanyl-D-alanine carboxypeptidase, partial [Gloeobacteraceae cyanobacterium ES-bin-316]|nr:D-alanyl-D-alanine carboxypeptidase [Ferruginibacter sp.]